MDRQIAPKKGLRVLGIAESFVKESDIKKSVLAGVVMRADMQIDGFSFDFCTLRGLDSTEAMIRLYHRLERKDIRAIIISGTIISLYNVVDLHELYSKCGRPIIAVTYQPSEGIEKYLQELPDADRRLEIYRRNGQRIMVKLKNGYYVYIRPIGIMTSNAVEILNLYAIHGRYIEPLRVARILARSLYKFLFLEKTLPPYRSP